MGARFDQLSPKVQEMVRAATTGKVVPGATTGHTLAAAAYLMATTPKNRIKQQRKGDGMNKWEREYLATLDIQWSHVYREVSLPLANGLRYLVDFLVASTANGQLRVEGHEVKGFARSTGIAKVKMAARLYPWISFRLVTKQGKRSGGGWEMEDVLS